MNFAFINIQGGLRYTERQRMIADTICDKNLDYIGIIETNLEKSLLVPEIEGLFYEPFYDEETKYRLVVYSQRRLQLKQVKIQTPCPSIVVEGRGITIATIYNEYTNRSEKVRYDPPLRIIRAKKTISKIMGIAKSKVIIGGDMNLKWNDKPRNIQQYRKFVSDLGLLQLVDEITREGSENEEPSMIDHCYVKNILDPEIIVEDWNDSDHKIIILRAGRKLPCTQRKKKINVLKLNDEALKELGTLDDKVDTTNDITELNEICTDYLTRLTKKCTKTVTVMEGSASFYDKELLKLKESWMKERNKDLKRQKRKYYRKRYKEKFHAYEQKQRFKKGHAFPPKKCKQIEYLIEEVDGVERKITDKQEIANHSARFYRDKVLKLAEKVTVNYKHIIEKLAASVKVEEEWGISAPSEKEMLKILKSMPNKNSKGYDDLPYKVYRFARNQICKIMTKITSLSINEAKYITPWKFGQISNVHKKDSTTSIQHFRPVCQNPTSGKLVDKCGNMSLRERMEFLKLISKYFFGFRQGMSTTDALTTLLEDIQEARRRKLKLTMVMCDQSAAFDTVSHNFIKESLKALKANENTQDFVQSYLEGREMFVVHEGVKSENFSTPHIGTPQGGFLSVSCYLICTLSLPFFTNDHKCYIYADDNVCLVTSGNTETLKLQVQSTVESVIGYMDASGLSPNFTKSELLDPFGNGQSDVEIIHQGERKTIRVTDCTKFLGTLIGKRMKWDEEIAAKEKKLRQTAGYLFQVCQGKTMSERRSLFFGYAIGRLLHNFKAYSVELSNNQIKTLESSYRLMLRYAFGFGKRQRISITQLRLKHKIMDIAEYQFKSINELAFDKRDYFIKKSTTENKYTTRCNRESYRVQPFVDNVNGIRSRMVRITRAWNRYSTEWKHLLFLDEKKAKQGLKKWHKEYFEKRWKLMSEGKEVESISYLYDRTDVRLGKRRKKKPQNANI